MLVDLFGKLGTISVRMSEFLIIETILSTGHNSNATQTRQKVAVGETLKVGDGV